MWWLAILVVVAALSPVWDYSNLFHIHHCWSSKTVSANDWCDSYHLNRFHCSSQLILLHEWIISFRHDLDFLTQWNNLVYIYILHMSDWSCLPEKESVHKKPQTGVAFNRTSVSTNETCECFFFHRLFFCVGFVLFGRMQATQIAHQTKLKHILFKIHLPSKLIVGNSPGRSIEGISVIPFHQDSFEDVAAGDVWPFGDISYKPLPSDAICANFKICRSRSLKIWIACSRYWHPCD